MGRERLCWATPGTLALPKPCVPYAAVARRSFSTSGRQSTASRAGATLVSAPRRPVARPAAARPRAARIHPAFPHSGAACAVSSDAHVAARSAVSVVIGDAARAFYNQYMQVACTPIWRGATSSEEAKMQGFGALARPRALAALDTQPRPSPRAKPAADAWSVRSEMGEPHPCQGAAGG